MHCNDYENLHSRRDFLSKFGLGLGALSLAGLINPLQAAQGAGPQMPTIFHGGPRRAKRVIYLFQSGAPSQQDLFDHKPLLRKMNGQELPPSIRQGAAVDGHECRAGQFSTRWLGV